MDMQRLTCIQCKKKFHACGSCGRDTVAEDNGFCSANCLIASREFIEAKTNAQAFYDSLNDSQKKQFEQLESDEGKYEYMSLYNE